MARIPTPRLPGQEVGSVQLQGTPTPFQSFQTSADMFGAAQGRQLSQAGEALGQTADTLMATARTDDKVDQQRMEAEVKEFTTERQNHINGLSGQEKLDALKTAQADFESGVANITGKYKMRLASSDDISEVFVKNTNTSFLNFVGQSAKQARDVVAEQTTTTGIANAVTTAARATANPDPVARNKAYNTALVEAERLVKDPDIGLAKQAGNDPNSTDPAVKARVDLLVRETKMQVVDGMITALLADGKFEQAVNLLDQPTMQSIGEGTKTYSALEAKVLPFREKVLGMKEFAAMRSSSAKPDGTEASLSELGTAIYNETDPVKRARLGTEFALYSAQRNAATKEAANQEILRMFQVIQGGGVPSPSDFPTLMTQNPRLLQDASRRIPGIREATVQGDRQQEWEDADGSGYPNDPVFEYLKNTTPQERIQLASNSAIMKLMNAEQADAITAKLGEDRRAVQDAQSGEVINPSQILKELGFTTAKRGVLRMGNLLTDNRQLIENTIAEARQPFIDRGVKADRAAIKRAVAEALVSVRTAEGGFFSKDTYALSDAAEQEGVVLADAVLQKSRLNYVLISATLRAELPTIKSLADELDDDEFTLSAISSKLGIPNPTAADVRSAQAFDAAVIDYALDQNVPIDFVRTLAERAGITDLPRLADMMAAFNNQPAQARGAQLQRWFRSGR